MNSLDSQNEDDGWKHGFNADLYAQAPPPYEEVVIPWVLEYYRRRHLSDSKIPLAIDVACGSGQLCSQLAKICNRVIGVDISSSMLESAKKYNSYPNVEYKQGSVQELTTICAGEKADIVTVGMAVSYFDNDELYPKIAEILKPGGVFAALGFQCLGVQVKGLESFLIEYMLENFASQTYIKTIIQLIRCYKDVKVPFEDVERKEIRKLVPTNRHGITARMTSSPQNGGKGIDEALQKFPDGNFNLICDIFGVLSYR